MKLSFYNKNITDATLLDTRGKLVIAINHILDNNYGLAQEWVQEAMMALPQDTEGGVVWNTDEAPDVTTFNV